MYRSFRYHTHSTCLKQVLIVPTHQISLQRMLDPSAPIRVNLRLLHPLHSRMLLLWSIDLKFPFIVFQLWRNALCQVKFCNNKNYCRLFIHIDSQKKYLFISIQLKKQINLFNQSPQPFTHMEPKFCAFVAVTHRSERFGYSSRIRPMKLGATKIFKRKLFSGKVPMKYDLYVYIRSFKYS